MALLPALLTGCAPVGPVSGSDDRIVADGVHGAPSHDSAGPGGPASPARCEDLPHVWSGAHDIAYDPQSRVVRFGWPDGTTADVLDSAAGCAAQPGLEEHLTGHRESADASERASCRELGHLVDAVRADRRGRGQSTSGVVPVSAAARAAAAVRSGAPASDAAAKSGSGERMIDLDESDEVLEACPR